MKHDRPRPSSVGGGSRKHAGPRQAGLFAIALFKLLKGALLLVLAIGALGLVHHDVQEVVEGWINSLRLDPGNIYIARILGKLGLVDDRKLQQLSGLTTIYAGLFLTEGVGLLYRKRWAEFLTVIATASFIPVEIYEVIKHLTPTRIAFLAGNIFIVYYLIVLLRRERTAGRTTGTHRKGQ
jgi:uncharacterized membrane protein (DUF2068 family)